VPWHDLAAAGTGRWPGLRLDVYDGRGDPPGDVSDVEFYVLPYDTGSAPRDLLADMPKLRAVQALTAGVEKITPLLPEGVRLCNGRGLHDASTAEHALALMLSAQREIPHWVRAQQDGKWAHAHTRSLADSRVTIVGYGSIGVATERRLLACEARVTRVASHARPAQDVHGVDELPALLPETDILLLVLPETPSTVGIVGASELAALPDHALVVNVGRGRTLDTEALLAETASGRLRAALDVTDPEPLPEGHGLWHSPGVLVTPHVAGGASCFEPRARELVREQLDRFAAGKELANVVQ
jgi:phosphoglycerate dehydrogenase-like enzyme